MGPTHLVESSNVSLPMWRRALAVGVAEPDFAALLSSCEVQAVPACAEALQAVEKGLDECRPISLILADGNSPSGHYPGELLQLLWKLDPALQAIVIADDADDAKWENLVSLAADRCVLVRHNCHPSQFRQVAGALICKSQSERRLRRTSEELLALNGRRSIEIAAANADLINLNRKLESAKDAAESASRAKSAFLATMSHEIRTPMTAIVGYADYLLEEGDVRQAPRERIEAINTIVRNGRHLVQLINDILDLSKIEANRLEVERIFCKPLAIVNDVVSLMRGRAEEKKLTLRSYTDGPVPEVIQSDPTRLRQILVNVVGNAIKFTEQGSVTVVVRHVVDNSISSIQLEVVDTGIGLTRDQLDRLFQPFSQADMSMTRRFGGSGLGLCISQRFAEMLGGKIEVQSKPGKGTTFNISVATGNVESAMVVNTNDLKKSSEEDPYAVAEARRLNMQIAAKILVAEDGIDNQRLIAHLLRKAGADVMVVDNGALACEAIDAAAQGGEQFDIVLMDMQMPVLDGYAATRRLRSSGYELPIIALTAFAMTGDREKCVQAGCTDYLTKPLDRTVFLPLVAKYVETPKTRGVEAKSPMTDERR